MFKDFEHEISLSFASPPTRAHPWKDKFIISRVEEFEFSSSYDISAHKLSLLSHNPNPEIRRMDEGKERAIQHFPD